MICRHNKLIVKTLKSNKVGKFKNLPVLKVDLFHKYFKKSTLNKAMALVIGCITINVAEFVIALAASVILGKNIAIDVGAFHEPNGGPGRPPWDRKDYLKAGTDALSIADKWNEARKSRHKY